MRRLWGVPLQGTVGGLTFKRDGTISQGAGSLGLAGVDPPVSSTVCRFGADGAE
ncbi:MAG: hypothetical protein NW237_12770 [Cyanobacteriota bacterium]|nr:hypothetical protein [Cyanobacteriota bacterium]